MDQITACDLRKRIAALRVPLYVLAGRAEIHPTLLGELLRERRRLGPIKALQICSALDELECETQLEGDG